jgi:hypothetical protein
MANAKFDFDWLVIGSGAGRARHGADRAPRRLETASHRDHRHRVRAFPG